MDPKLSKEGRRQRIGIRLRSIALLVLALAAVVLVLLIIRAFHLICVSNGRLAMNGKRVGGVNKKCESANRASRTLRLFRGCKLSELFDQFG